VVHARLGTLVGDLEEVEQLALGAVEHEVALPGHEMVRTGVAHQLRVRVQRQSDQGFVLARDLLVEVRGGVAVVGPQRAQHARGVAGVVAHVHALVGRAREQKAEVSRQGIRRDGFALDDAGVAIRSFKARGAPVEQRDGLAAGLQVQCATDADHAGAENDDVVCHAESLSSCYDFCCMVMTTLVACGATVVNIGKPPLHYIAVMDWLFSPHRLRLTSCMVQGARAQSPASSLPEHPT
jgi:hypothetical protein